MTSAPTLDREQSMPLFVDCGWLIENLRIKDKRTIDSWIRAGRLPPPLPGACKGSKRLWRGADVLETLEGKKKRRRMARVSDEARIRDNARRAIGG